MSSPAETTAQGTIASLIVVIQTNLATISTDVATIPVNIELLTNDTSDSNFPAGQLTMMAMSDLVNQLATDIGKLTTSVNALCTQVIATGTASATFNPSPA